MSKQDETLKISTELLNSFLNIPENEMHPDDLKYFRFHLHKIQDILYQQKSNKGKVLLNISISDMISVMTKSK